MNVSETINEEFSQKTGLTLSDYKVGADNACGAIGAGILSTGRNRYAKASGHTFL